MTGISRTATVHALPHEVWAVLADFGGISAWVPLIQHSCLLSEQTDGIGAVRRVQIARQTLVERVTTWDPPRTLTYTIEGLPPIVGIATNTWTLTPTGSATTVALDTEIDTGRNPAKALIARKVLERMATASELMLAGLTAAAEPAVDDTADQATHPPHGGDQEQR